MATAPKPWPDSAMSDGQGVAGKITNISSRETCPGRVTSCISMGSLTTPIQFFRPTGEYDMRGMMVSPVSVRVVCDQSAYLPLTDDQVVGERVFQYLDRACCTYTLNQ